MSVSCISQPAVALLLMLAFAPHAVADASDDHAPTSLQLTAEQRQLANIRVGLPERGFNPKLSANAVLNVDRDLSYTLVPQLDVRVLQRHISPGQLVSKGQPLLTLGGVEVAQAQATFINAASDWQRISAMSKTAVSDSERAQAQVAVEQARAILEALQMTSAQIAQLRDRPELIGSFQLLAPMAGRVQQDHSQLGQLQQAGNLLLQLSDESSLWVEAELTPSQAESLAAETEILVRIEARMVSAKVIGRTHQFNASTRTERLLARIDNRETRWHAGQFAEVLLPQPGIDGVLLPDSALTRSADGDWQVFIDTPAGFVAQEVDVLQRQRGVNLVDGIAASQTVVLSGAFFLAAELAKSGFDIHNH
ncbi:efflux RND transporter periplasmic adaptor subunit [Shewanella sp. C32]|uniref:Efflux RND transporter periplasmic adaptor subunit n=1 Tax=Shewanella electrica TaxID=515560 RepID=A0ABT2FI96_9GAMM|nr:efflux RND transporter periplasmic adaptor subunit [Shewanella electrica]MCH1924080.1 efflux RND transporter periplasmic adaptor subunit [Shewanella electrica]MCS4555983.1 efflux RND transporter periplasmic adaptor subunit [Shewanella electrica]